MKKRATVRRFEDDEYDQETEMEHDTGMPNGSKSEPNKSSGSKIWSFVSTFLRFASLAPPSDLSMSEMKTNDNKSHLIVKRCASFTGTVIDVLKRTIAIENRIIFSISIVPILS